MARTAELEILSVESERRRTNLQTVVQHIPAGLVIFDAETAREMANERAREMMAIADGSAPAWTPDEWNTYAEFTVDARGRRPLDRVLAGETLHGERVTVERQDGPPVLLDLNAAPIRGARGRGGRRGRALPGRDARPRRGAARRSSSSRTRRTSCARRSPRSGARVEVLQSGAKDVPVERDRFLGHIERECAAAARLGRAMLVLARAQTGSEAPRLGRVAAARRCSTRSPRRCGRRSTA